MNGFFTSKVFFGLVFTALPPVLTGILQSCHVTITPDLDFAIKSLCYGAAGALGADGHSDAVNSVPPWMNKTPETTPAVPIAVQSPPLAPEGELK